MVDAKKHASLEIDSKAKWEVFIAQVNSNVNFIKQTALEVLSNYQDPSRVNWKKLMKFKKKIWISLKSRARAISVIFQSRLQHSHVIRWKRCKQRLMRY